MKKILLLLLAVMVTHFSDAQNVGIGTTEPYNKLQVAGNFLVSAPTKGTSTAPTAAQTKTMINGSTSTFLAADSTGIIYDPGGPSGNYLPNLTSMTVINNNGASIGIELTAESLQLGNGDSLIIKDFAASADVLLAVGNGYNATGNKWIFNKSQLHILFKSNADASVGSGFKLLFRRLYDNSASLPEVGGIAGNGFFFDTKNGSLRAGLIKSAERGQYSIALGRNVAATGDFTTAMGYSTSATGYSSTAMGVNTTASAYSSTAMGYFTVANGYSSTAMGYSTLAGGSYSTAVGSGSEATGNASTAMGKNTIASGDNSTSMGKYSIASGYAATAMGDSTEAMGTMSFAGGYRSKASATYATAMGSNTIASGLGSTALGTNTKAIGDYSTATGLNTRAIGNYSTATGVNTEASGSYSTALGYYTDALGYASTVVGMHNRPMINTAQTTLDQTTPLFIVGNGVNSVNPSNALTVLFNGNVGIGTWEPPVAPLQVVGGKDADLTPTSGYLVIGNVNNASMVIDDNEIIARNNGANATLYLQNEGGALVVGGTASKPGGGSWTATSDARLKQHVQPYSDGLQQLQKINPVYFNYNQQSG